MLPGSALVGFIPTKDFVAAKASYRDVLQLRLESEDSFALVFKSEGTPIRVTKVGKFTPFPFTVLGWNVTDIRRATADLAQRGVTFERFPGLKQDDTGIWDAPGGARVAWFKDPDGNLLSLSQLS